MSLQIVPTRQFANASSEDLSKPPSSETCHGLFEKLADVARQVKKQISSSNSVLSEPSNAIASLRAGRMIEGKFSITPIDGHTDVFLVTTSSKQSFIFRTDYERAKLEVSVYRFAREAGFNVPATTYAKINGHEGSAQELVTGAQQAADFVRENGWKEEPWHLPDPVTQVFDSILAMNDRNSTNYFITPDRRQILIDHEQAFYSLRDNMVLRDGNNQIIDEKVMRRFIQSDPERARRMADVANESNFLWALRDLTEQQQATFRERIKLYRQLYRRALVNN